MILNLRDIHWGEFVFIFYVGFQRFEPFFGRNTCVFFPLPRHGSCGILNKVSSPIFERQLGKEVRCAT